MNTLIFILSILCPILFGLAFIWECVYDYLAKRIKFVKNHKYILRYQIVDYISYSFLAMVVLILILNIINFFIN